MKASFGPTFRYIWAMKPSSIRVARTIPPATIHVDRLNIEFLLFSNGRSGQFIPRRYVGDAFFVARHDDFRSFFNGASVVTARTGHAPRAGMREDHLARSFAFADGDDDASDDADHRQRLGDRLALREGVDGAVDDRAAGETDRQRAAFDDRQRPRRQSLQQ